MPSLIIDLVIPADELLRYYRGEAGVVHTRARDGRRIQFPANVLRAHVGRDGVRGTFRLFFTPDGKFERIERLL